MTRRRVIPRAALVVAAVWAVVLGGCSGTSPSVGPVAAASPTPAPTPSPSPTAAPTSVATAATIGGSSPTTVTLPTVAGVGVSIVFPGGQIASGTTLSATNGPAWSVGNGFVPQPRGITIVDYVTFESDLGFTVSTFPEFIVTLPQASSTGEAFYLSLYRPDSGWHDNAMGPASVSGVTVTFAPTQLSTPLPFYPKSVYAVAVDAVAADAAAAHVRSSPEASRRASKR